MDRPITLTIAALGGQGGGVVQDWMVRLAQNAGCTVQATSVPGVAQRTGATIYYLEFWPAGDGRQPVMGLMPAAGVCDLVIASELVEAVRMVQRGFVGEETTLVTSTHRAYTIAEKSDPADGRAEEAELWQVLEEKAGRLLAFDMDAVAKEAGSVISAAMLGGIAAAQVLPFALEHFEQAIEQGGKGVAPSLAAFRGALAAAAAPRAVQVAEVPAPAAGDPRLADLPEAVAVVAGHALPRLEDYQDSAYVDEYLSLLEPFLACDADDYALPREVARGLALWMTFEDTIRVADLKTRPERLRPYLEEQQNVVRVTEFMKPRMEEISGTLPRALGAWLMRSPIARTLLTPLTSGLKIRSTSLWGYGLLRVLAGMKRWRRASLRYSEEMKEIRSWLSLLARLADSNPTLALSVAESQQLVSGYGDTHAEGLEAFRNITATAEASL